ncbi:competence protein ComGF [Cerasibacillus quisquiliarum]|uniref:Competence protein ComGF n=1 Tax=Cerasibacillus quisquiliarum TaxID=227865 RepID=A0A511UWW4_9BACI|nr:ComGF family competence protein [Cerasibacillus quisquiliarum]MBB5145498.1 competence protein ComGF [Cerasibacillus quisquiliarum]GEN31107.1 hypothetical protein CQU01_13450 [Cerasibacillus quisquiliarum]
MAFLKNETGFTLINTLLSFVLITCSLPFLIVLLQKSQELLNLEEELSVQHFFYFLQDDVKRSIDYQIIRDELYMTLDTGKQVQIGRNGHVIRRTVDQKGYEIYLRNVQSFHLYNLKYGFLVSIEMTTGGQYEKEIIFYNK